MAEYLIVTLPTGGTYYAKPWPIDSDPSWGDDVQSLTESGTVSTLYESAEIASPADEYAIFEQAGGSPADTDSLVAVMSTDAKLDAIPTAAENRAEMDSNSTQLAAIDGKIDTLDGVADNVWGVVNDLQDGERLDLILDAAASGHTTTQVALAALQTHGDETWATGDAATPIYVTTQGTITVSD